MKFVSVNRKVRSGGEMKGKIKKSGWKRERGQKGKEDNRLSYYRFEKKSVVKIEISQIILLNNGFE